MGLYLQEIANAGDQCWRLIRGWILDADLQFYDELRQEQPILVLPEATIATLHNDCKYILDRPDLFSVALYKPKLGLYWMAQDDTAIHHREKAIMQVILDFDDLPAIRALVAEKSRTILASANRSIEAVEALTRAVPIALVREWFGFANSDPAQLRKWSYWNQMDAFWNQPFDAFAWQKPAPDDVAALRKAGTQEMARYIAGLVKQREAEFTPGSSGRDLVSKLVALSRSDSVKDFDAARAILNVGGLLIGTVEPTSHAAVNALDWLLRHPDILARARDASANSDPSVLTGYVTEALRFVPAFPYFFRTAEQDTVLGSGTPHETPVAKGTTVLALTHAAMFDPAETPDPNSFDPGRGWRGQFLFGHGLHECVGRAIAEVMITEIVRQALLLENLQTGPVDFKGGPVPEAWNWQWG